MLCRVCGTEVKRTGKRGPAPIIHKECHNLERAVALLSAAVDGCPSLPKERAQIVRADIWGILNRPSINPRNRKK